MRQALQMHESVIHKNREELTRYRAYMETRDNEMHKIMKMEEERLQMVLDEYKVRYDRERSRLQEALVKAANCAQTVSDGLADCLSIERQLFGYRYYSITISCSMLLGPYLVTQLFLFHMRTLSHCTPSFVKQRIFSDSYACLPACIESKHNT